MAKDNEVVIVFKVQGDKLQAAIKGADKFKKSTDKATKATKRSTVTTEKATKAINKQTAAKTRSTRATRKASTAATEFRNKSGVARQESLSGAKAFSKQAQGMGGLVQAYATVAANAFALTAAFGVLKRAADFDSMVKSARNLEAKVGVNIKTLTRDIRDASGAALSLAEALPAINKAVASGFSTVQIKELSVLATKAAQSFGGSTVDALNRFTDAVLRGRTELISRLGIVISIEEASAKYASQLGKTTKELSGFERRQAIINAVLEEGNRALGNVVIDPNPFTRLATAFQDLAQDMFTVIENTDNETISLNNIVTAISKSTSAVIALGIAFGSSIIKRALPLLATELSAIKKNARAAVIASNLKIAAVEKTTASLITQLNIRKLIRKKAADEEVRSILRKNGVIANAEGNLFERILASNKAIDIADANAVRALTARHIKSLAIRKLGIRGLTNFNLAEIARLEVAILSGNKVIKSATLATATAVQVMGSRVTTTFARITSQMASFKATTLSTSALIGTAISTGGLGAGITAFNIRLTALNRLQRMGTASGIAFARANVIVAGSLRLLGAALGTVIGFLSSLALPIFAIVTLWSLFGDKLRGITKEERDFIDQTKKTNEALGESNKKLQDFINLQENGITSIRDLSGQFLFLKNAVEATSSVLKDSFTSLDVLLNKAAKDTTLNDTVVANLAVLKAAFDNLKKVQEESVNLGRTQKALALSRAGASLGEARRDIDKLDKILKIAKDGVESSLEAIPEAILGLDTLLERSGITSERVAGQFEVLSSVFENIGIDISDDNLKAFNTSLTASLKTGDSLLPLFERLNLSNSQFVQLGSRVFEIIFKTANAAKNALGEVQSALVAARTSILSFNSSLSTAFKTIIDKGPNKELIRNFEQLGKAMESIPKEAQFEFLDTTETRILIRNLGLAANVDFSVLKDEVDKVKEIFLKFSFAARNLRNELKVLAFARLEQNARILKSDKEVADKFFQIETIKQKALNVTINTTKLEIAAREENIKFLLRNEANNARTIEAKREELRIVKLLLANQRILRDALDPILAFNIKILEAAKKEEATKSTILGINKKIADGEFKILISSEDRLDALKKVQRIEIDVLIQKSRVLALEEFTLRTVEKQTDESRRQLSIIKARTEELKTQARLLAEQQVFAEISETARSFDLENNLPFGGALFGEDSELRAEEFGSIMGDAFGVIFEQRMKALTPNIIKLAKGVFDAISAGVDTLVQTIGTAEFNVSSILNAVKEVVRTTLLDVFATNIKNAIFDALGFKDRAAEIQKRIANKTEKILAQQIEQTDLLTKVVSLLGGETTSKGATASTAPNTLISKVFGTSASSTVSGAKPSAALKGISGIFKSSAPGKEDENARAQKATLTDINNSILDQTQVLGESISGISETINQQSANLMEVLQAIRVCTCQTAANTAVLAATSASGGGFDFAGLISKASQFSSGSDSFVGPLEKIATGGIVTSPTRALIGEGGQAEAVVPLPNNREIPVKLEGGGNTFRIEQNFDFTNADPASESRIRTAMDRIKRETLNDLVREINKGGRLAKTVGRR